MSFETFTGPDIHVEKYIRKFLRICGTIYTGPEDEGHDEMAKYFNIVGEIEILKKESRKDVDGGNIEVDNTTKPPFVQFDNSSGSFELYYHEEARQDTLLTAKPSCPNHEVRIYKPEEPPEFPAPETPVRDWLDPYDQEDSYFNMKRL